MNDTTQSVKKQPISMELREGGPGEGERPVSVGSLFFPANLNPTDLYYGAKFTGDAWLNVVRTLSPSLHTELEESMQHTERYSSASIASAFERLSNFLWTARNATLVWFGAGNESQIPLQSKRNHYMWVHNDRGDLSRIRSSDICPLFEQGKEKDWPNLILTSNHARAWRDEDLLEVMQGIERVASDGWRKDGQAWNAPLHHYALPMVDNESHRQSQKQHAAGRNIIALACHTERDIFCNGAKLLRRRLALEADTENNVPPEKRTLACLSPASLRLSKLMLKCMATQPSQDAINLDFGKDFPEQQPFIANDASVKGSLVLRADAASIAQHIKLVGYSRGANTVADALRMFYRECVELGMLNTVEPSLTKQPSRLMIEDAKTRVIRPATDKDVRVLINNIGLLSLAPGEVPITKEEGDRVGIERIGTLNTHDLTAGHLVKPDASQYNKFHSLADKLFIIEGDSSESGHSLRNALGDKYHSGYIMNPPKDAARGSDTLNARDNVKAFFASCMGKQAIITSCLSHRDTAAVDAKKGNELYLQFAHGVGKANEEVLHASLKEAFDQQGLKIEVASDLVNRRRLQIHFPDELQPCNAHPTLARKCHQALKSWEADAKNNAFVADDAYHHLEKSAEHIPSYMPNTPRVGEGRVSSPLATKRGKS